MNSNVKRCMVNIDGTNKEAEIGAAFNEAFKLCQQDDIDVITVLVPMKDGFEIKMIGEYLGQPLAKALRKGEKIPLEQVKPGLVMELESSHTMSEHKEYGVVMAMQLSPKSLNKLEGIFSAKAVIYLPWMISEKDEWGKLHNHSLLEA